MYCPNCGKEIEEGAAFCSGCGAAQSKSERERPRLNVNKQEGEGIPYNTMCIIGAVLSGISLFYGLIGIAGFIVSRIGSKQVAETGSVEKSWLWLG